MFYSQSSTAKKAPARGKAASSQQVSSKSKQATLSFAPSGAGGRTRRTAATAARGKMQKVVSSTKLFFLIASYFVERVILS